MTEEMMDVVKEENTLIFNSFDAIKAYKIGCKIADYAIQKDLQVGVRIETNGKLYFQFLTNKCTPDNVSWLKRKLNTVCHFHRSSKFVHLKLQGDATLINTKYGLKQEDYAVIQGGFPIVVKNCGFIGAIAVSGLLPEEDHNLIVDVIKNYLD